MSEEQRTVRNLIRRLTAEDERTLDSTPSNEELSAYLAGELDVSQSQKLREHLSIDRRASRALLELASDSASEAGSVLSSDQRHSDRQALRARLDSDAVNQVANATATQTLNVIEAAAVAAIFSRLRRTRLMVFVTGIAFLGLLGWHLGKSRGDYRSPPAVEVIADSFVRPVGDTVRGGEDINRILISEGQRHIYLTLAAINESGLERVKLVISSDANPPHVSEYSGLPINGQFPLRLKLEAEQLPRGQVRLTLYGESDESQIAEYLITIIDD